MPFETSVINPRRLAMEAITGKEEMAFDK